MAYKTELHCHTSEFSRCARFGGAETAELYIENGYSTVVLTNHFAAYYPHRVEYERFVSDFFEAGEVMQRAAGDRLTVIMGMELTFAEAPTDFLVYGMTAEMLLSLPEIFDMGQREFFAWAEEHGVIIVQAHPLRFKVGTREPWYLHGAEVYNAANDPFCNKAAEAWAELCEREVGRRFIRTSGSDRHRADQTLGGGIETDFKLETMAQLVEVLRSGDYTLLRG